MLAAMTIEEWLWRLEGAYEQVSERLGEISARPNTLEQRMDTMNEPVNARFDSMNNRLDAMNRLTLGGMALILAAIVGLSFV